MTCDPAENLALEGELTLAGHVGAIAIRADGTTIVVQAVDRRTLLSLIGSFRGESLSPRFPVGLGEVLTALDLTLDFRIGRDVVLRCGKQARSRLASALGFPHWEFRSVTFLWKLLVGRKRPR